VLLRLGIHQKRQRALIMLGTRHEFSPSLISQAGKGIRRTTCARIFYTSLMFFRSGTISFQAAMKVDDVCTFDEMFKYRGEVFELAIVKSAQ
jgi:hypothetical protein